jgi:hypothetical protein
MKRRSADAQARLEYAAVTLMTAYRLQRFATFAGAGQEVAPEAMRSLERDVDRARQGKTIARWDAFGGRGFWKRRAA